MAPDDNCTTNSSCTADGFKQVIYPVVYLFIFLLGAAGNGLSIYVFLQPSRSKTSVNIYLHNLAISDLMLVSTLPFRATYFLLGSHWVFGDTLCRIMTYTLYVNMYCSIYFLTVLSVVRFAAIVYPFKHCRATNTKCARSICAAIWVFVLAASSPLLNKEIAGYSNPAKCLDLHPSSSHDLLVMNNLVLVVGFLLPFCTIVVCYILAIRALLRSRALQLRKVACHRKALATIIITLLLFLLCFLPYHVLRTVHLALSSCSRASLPLHKALVLSLCLADMNSCLDPILYYFAAERFKAKLWSLCSRYLRQNCTSYACSWCHRCARGQRLCGASLKPSCSVLGMPGDQGGWRELVGDGQNQARMTREQVAGCDPCSSSL